MKKIIISKRWQLSLRDWLKALSLSVATPMLFEVQKTLDSGTFSVNWKQVAMIGLGAAVAYIIKQLLGAPKVTTTYASNEKAEEVAKELR